ncbi:MAG: PAS domain S-box protein [bacterium]
MNDSIHDRYCASKLIGLFVIAVGSAVMLGWLLDISWLKSVLPGFVTMKANTALGFVFAGVALVLLAWASQSATVRRLAQACAAAVALLGLLTLVQYGFGLNFGIDQFFVHEPPGTVGTFAPGRMALNTALNFLVLGCALLLAGSRRGIATVQCLAIFTGLMGMLPLLGYLYGATTLLGIGQYTQMALHTALLFIMLSSGALLLHPTEGLMRLITSDTRGGWLLRWMAPLVAGIPLLLGWLRVWGERSGYYESALGTALMMMTLMLLLIGVIWWTAKMLDQYETERQREEEKLQESKDYLDNLIDYANAPIIVWNPQFRITRFNHAFEAMTGRSESEVIGKTLEFLFPRTQVDSSMALISTTTGGERWETVEISIIHIDGSVRTVLWNSATIYNAERTVPVATIAQGHNITERKQAEDTLRESEEQFRIIFDRSTVGKSLTAPDGKLMKVNTTFATMLGLTVEEMQSVNFAAITHPDDVAESRECIRRLLAKECATYHMEKRYRHTDGHYVWTDVSTTLFRDSQDQPRYFITGILDISLRKQAEDTLRESEAKYRTLVENIPQKILMKDRDYRWVSINENLASDFGFRPEEVVGKTDDDLFSPELAAKYHADDVRIMDTGKTEELEERYIVDGNETWIDIIKTPVRDTTGEIVGILGVFWDITERKQAEEVIRKLNDELEQRVIERTAELEAVNHELEAFSYSVSHDLKAPLRAVDGFAGYLEEDYGDRLDDEGRRLLTVIRDSARDMGQLVNDLLAFSRLSRKELVMTRLEMERLVHEVWTQLAPSHVGRQVTLHVGTLPVAAGDVATVREVLVNLLANAIKFTSTRKQAVVEVSGYVEAGEVVYAVKDNGVGFDMIFVNKLFGVFQRLHGTEEFEGTGIGLALVQRIILRHGGRVWAEGTVNEGATFYFTLPQYATKE